eukprot:gene5298-3801_t
MIQSGGINDNKRYGKRTTALQSAIGLRTQLPFSLFIIITVGCAVERMNSFNIMTPKKFRETLKKDHKVEEDKGDAYREFIANCRALTLKANTALTQQTDAICCGEVIDLERNYVGSAGLQAMTTLLSKNSNLRELRIPANGIGNDAVVFLCRSLREHPTLNLIDLSSNDSISLAGGLALLSLAQQNPNIRTILVAGSQIPEPVLKKIDHALEKNRSRPPAKIALPLSTTSQPPIELADRQKLREASRMDRWKQKEAEQLARLQEKAPQLVLNGPVPPALPNSGWRVLEIAILAPPGIFESEREALLEKVFPRLNEEMKSRRVLLLPMVNAADSPPGVYLRQLRFSLSCDIVADVQRSRFASIELIGDRAGDYQQPPSNVMIDSALKGVMAPTLTANGAVDTVVSAMDPAAPPLNPVLYTGHQEVMKSSNWVIIATRRDTRRLGIPPSLAPLLSGEPPVEHPDKHKSLVKKLAVETTLCKPNATTVLTTTTSTDTVTTTVSAVVKVEASSRIGCSHLVEQLKWEEHQAFKAQVLANAPVKELIIEDYQANFDRTKPTGDIAMKDLDDFIEAVYQRLHILLTATFPVVEPDSQDHFAGPLSLQKIHAIRAFQRSIDQKFCTVMSQYGGHKKTITNRLNLYVATPPSRNSLFLHGAYTDVLTPLLSVSATRFLNAVSGHTVAMHSTRFATLYSEPTDLRSVIFHILSQLTSNPEVLRYLQTEVDLRKIKHFFSDFLSGGTRNEDQLPVGMPKVTANTIGSLNSNDSTHQVFLVILDGLDAIDTPVDPCPALRQTETGEDEWDAVLPESWRTRDDGVDFIPKCLARNVRLIASSNTSSHLLDRLRVRGRDSCEFLDVGDSTANDIEVTLCPSTLEKFNVILSDDDHTLAQRKADSGNPEYMRYLIDAVRQLGEVPSFVKQTEFIASFPEDVAGAASRVLENLYLTFGQPLITKALGLLTASRWGILLPDFRTLLKLTPKRMNELLRCLRPVIETFSSSEIGECSGNVLLSVVRIVSPSFLELLESERFQVEGAEEDEKVWHALLAQHYQSIIFVANTEEKSLIYGSAPTSPYEGNAVKEFIFHATKARMWGVIDVIALSPKFLMLVYRNGLAYQYLRDLIFCYNERSVARLLEGESGTDGGEKNRSRATASIMPPAFNRMKDFIYFVRDHSAILLEYPHLVLQIALQCSEREGCVQADALSYIRKFFYSYHGESHASFFRIVETKKKPRLHMGEISSVAFAWNRRHVITGGADRAISWVEPNTGKVPYQVHQPSARVRVVLNCSTSAYVAAMAVNRSVYIFDGAFGKLISKNEGDDFTAPVSAFSFSARGRYYVVATDDLVVRVYDSEKGVLLMTLGCDSIAAPEEREGIFQKRNVIEVMCNPIDDEMLYTFVNHQICVWRIVETRDGCVCKAVMMAPCTCSNPQWCWEPTAPAGDEGILDRSRYILCQANETSAVLLDLFNSRIVSKFSMTTSNEQGENVVCAITKVAIAPNHKLVGVATKEGFIGVFPLDWQSIEMAEAEAKNTAPLWVFDAFSRTAHPTIIDFYFRYDNASIFALGNERHMKYWVLPSAMFDGKPDDEPTSRQEIIRSADGDYVHPVKTTAMSVARIAEHDMVEVAIGDVSGQLTLLKIFVPAK